ACSNFLSFFYQAEDGIRGFHVTGVQTCALPISSSHHVDTIGRRLSRIGRLRKTKPAIQSLCRCVVGKDKERTFLNAEFLTTAPRSEERRVGKECRPRGSPYRDTERNVHEATSVR